MTQSANTILEKRFGRLIVLEDSKERDKCGRIMWKCLCDCGNYTNVVGSSLKSGNTRSCGCMQKEQTSDKHGKVIKGYIGEKFNKLLVLNSLRERGRTHFECLCDCGVKVKIRADGVVNGHSKSCGCWNAEVLRTNVGKNSPSYKHEITDEERVKGRFLHKEKMKKWRIGIFNRDNFTCQLCFKRGCTLHAHHLNGYHWDIDNRFNQDNGVTLCEDCHRLFHKKYGTRRNTKKQFEEFKNNQLGQDDA